MHGKATLLHGTLQVFRGIAEAQRISGLSFKVLLIKSFNPEERFGFDEAVRAARGLGIEHSLEWHDPVPFEGMFQLMRECDLGVIAYTRVLGENSMPNRIFEYMALGIPTICPSYARELVTLVHDAECGILVDVEDPSALGRAFADLASSPKESIAMGDRGRTAFASRFNMERELEPFVEWIRHTSDFAHH